MLAQISRSFAQAVGGVLARRHQAEGRLREESHTSSKPPSPDGPTRKTRSQRIPSGRKIEGHRGHLGCTLSLVEQPDEVLRHRPDRCTRCQQPLEGVAGEVLLGLYQAAREWRERGATRLPAQERDEWVGPYFDGLACGVAAQPPPPEAPRRQRG